MHLAVLTLDFHLEACNSLKEKRRRLKGLRDRFGKLPHVAVCESSFADKHDKAQWSFACLSHSRADIQSSFSSIEEHATTQLDAVLYRQEVEYF